MPLAAGSKLAFYEVLAPIGAGAMGEVYRAKDTKLGREVAIKVLPEHFASDEERLRRFEREAKTLATVNHPNVAQIHGVDQVGDTCFLVLELVPGENLDECLKKGSLSLDDALDICGQIAEGLEAAHEAGVIHRDLKPANIRITPEGKVKLLDFGLAKPIRAGFDGQSTGSALSTEQGRLLGTPTYMAPEQARGKTIDKRVDVWAFGCVLFECLTEKRAFDGASLGDVLASVLEHEPDWSALPTATPARVRELVRRCLVKEPRDRLRDIGEARVALESTEEPVGAGGSSHKGAAQRRWIVAAGLLVALVLGAVLGAVLRPAESGAAQPRVTRLSVAVPKTNLIAPPPGMGVMALAPDGRSLAYCAQLDGVIRLFVRQLESGETTAIPGSADAHNPFFSFDGQWIAFFAAERLKKASVHGGDPIELCPAQADRCGAWLEDGSIVFSPSMAGPLYRISSAGGAIVPITQLDSGHLERTHRWPCALPGGEWVLFIVGTTDRPADYDRAIVAAVSLKTGERRELYSGAGMVRYSPSGHLILGRPGAIFAVPFDAATLKVTGSELAVVNGVLSDPGSGIVQFDVARDGTLAYVAQVPGFEDCELVWLDRAGLAEPLPVPAQPYWLPRISPDGKKLLFSIGPTWVLGDLWSLDLEHAKLNRLTFDQHCGVPNWSPDGAQIAYLNEAHGFRVELMSLDPSVEARLVLSRTGLVPQPTCFMPDGSGLLFQYLGDPKDDIQFVPLDGQGAARAIVENDSAQWGGRVSPDGRWLAFVSNETGRDEVFVSSWSRPAAKWQVSNSGGLRPVWQRDGKRLYYVRGRTLICLDCELQGAEFSAGVPRELFALPETRGVPKELANYDISNDGQRIITTRIAHPSSEIRNIELVLGWSEELRRLAPAKK